MFLRAALSSNFDGEAGSSHRRAWPRAGKLQDGHTGDHWRWVMAWPWLIYRTGIFPQPSDLEGRNYLSWLPKYTMVARCYRRNRSLRFISEGSGLERSIFTFHSAKGDRLAVLTRVLILVAV
jgi:hypothetical protein